MWVAKLAPEAIVALVAAGLGICAFLIDRVARPALRALRRAREPRRLARALGELRCGVQLQTFTDALGQAPVRSFDRSHLYVFDAVFVEAETDAYGNVGRFAVTVRIRYVPGSALVASSSHSRRVGPRLFAMSNRAATARKWGVRIPNIQPSFSRVTYIGFTLIARPG